MRVNLARGFKPLGPCKPHGEVLSIAAGGPSLADAFGEIQGHVAAGNGSLGYLIERGVVPHFCVVIDAMPHMAEIVVPDNGVYYLLSTSCDLVSIAANGPSLADTFGEMQGHVAAGNGSLGYLIERGVVRTSASSSTPCLTWPRSSSPTTVSTTCCRHVVSSGEGMHTMCQMYGPAVRRKAEC